MPELGHGSHKQQGDSDQAHSPQNDQSRAYSVDHRSGQETKRQTRHKKSKEKALRNLGASEPKGLHKRGIEDWESIKNDSHGKKKVQKRRDNNPPAVEYARWSMVRHGNPFSYEAEIYVLERDCEFCV